MERIEFGPGSDGSAIRPKNSLGCCCAVDQQDWNIPHLDLIYWAVLLGPLSVLLGRVGAYLMEISDQRQPARPWETGNARLKAYYFVDNNVGEESRG